MKTFEYMPEIAKLGHVALISKDLEQSLVFFKDIIGLEETKVVDGVHYLRAWGDFEHHTLSIAAGEESRVDHIAWKTKRKEDVDNFAILLKEAGIDIEQVAPGVEAGQGAAIRFQLPSGHSFELYFEMEKPEVEKSRRSILKNQTYKAWGKGVSPRRIDHVNLATKADAKVITDFLIEKLGFKMREYIKAPDGSILSGWMSVTNLVHDIAVMSEPKAPTTHEIHHIAYWSDNAQDILRAADILADQGFKFVGPGKHGISQALYLYVVDPGSGIRVELFSNGYLIFEPDWEPVEWTVEDMAFGFTFWGQQAGLTEEEAMTINAGPAGEEVKAR